MNVINLKPPPGRHHATAEEALASWHDLNQSWVVWPGLAERVTQADELRIRLAGFTHLRLVWWNGEQVMFVMKELK